MLVSPIQEWMHPSFHWALTFFFFLLALSSSTSSSSSWHYHHQLLLLPPFASSFPLILALLIIIVILLLLIIIIIIIIFFFFFLIIVIDGLVGSILEEQVERIISVQYNGTDDASDTGCRIDFDGLRGERLDSCYVDVR